MKQTHRETLAVSGCVVLGLMIWATADSWSPEAWTALAAWVTVYVAAGAAYVALRQLIQAEKLRREQAQPYVVAYIEPSEAGVYLIDLVVKNFGATAAHDVRLKIEPAPMRSIDEKLAPEHRSDWLPDRIPVLVPGQEWRTLWDTHQRYRDGEPVLPEYHEATVSYADSHGRALHTDAVLDWGMVAKSETVSIYGQHHAAKALREINETVKKWKEPAGGLRVTARDGDAKDRRAHEAMEARRAERDAQQASDPSDG